MLVSHGKKFIYTKTAKTAGTSVESYFEPFCMAPGAWQFEHAREETVSAEGIIGYRGADTQGRRWFNHMSCEMIRQQLGAARWEQYFKFAVIRNPFDKLLSGYFFAQRPAGTDAELIAGFRRWVQAGGAIIDRHTYTIAGQVCLDYFIRYEELDAGIAEVCRRLNLPFDAQRIPRLKADFRERHIPLQDFYDKDTCAIAATTYAFELEYFHYQRPV
jgi:hypothetical protein